MNKLMMMLVLATSLFTGCKTAMDIIEILEPAKPTPVCDRDSIGVRWNGCQCMKLSDGSYQWVKLPENTKED